MPALSTEDQERVFFHTRMTGDGAYWAEDKATALQRMNTISSNTVVDYIVDLLNRLDDTWERLNPDSIQRFSYKELVAGDVNRTVLRDDPRSLLQTWERIYSMQVSTLCQTLGIADYYNNHDLHRYVQDGGTYIKSVPGPADTAVSSRRHEYLEDLCGTMGVMVA